MQVVLSKDLKKLGYRGDLVEVKPGYFRNYLYPNGIAEIATAALIKLVEGRKDKMVMEKDQLREHAKEAIDKLKGLKISLKEKASPKGKLYAAVTEKEIIDAIEAKAKVKLEKDFIRMDHIKELGDHKVVIHLGPGLDEEVMVKVSSAS